MLVSSGFAGWVLCDLIFLRGPLGEVEDLGQVVLGGGGRGEHSAGFGTPAGRREDHDGLQDLLELVEELSDWASFGGSITRMMLNSNGQADQERPLTLDEARAEFPGLVVRLDQIDRFKLAPLVGSIRYEGALTAVATSYFDLFGDKPKLSPSAAVDYPPWMADWLTHLREHPLLPEVVRVWTAEQFGGAAASEETMLDMHLDFVLANHPDFGEIERPTGVHTAEALVIDDIAIRGVLVQGRQLMGAAARAGDLFVSVAVAGPLSDVVRRKLTSH